jgi:hypothetical protein
MLRFTRSHGAVLRRLQERAGRVLQSLAGVAGGVAQVSADLVCRERLVGRAITMYLARVLSSEPASLKSPFQLSEAVWSHKYMVDKASAAEKFSKKRFADMLAEFAEGGRLQRGRVHSRTELINKTFFEIAFEHKQSVLQRESDCDLLFKRHVSGVGALLRAGDRQVRAFRRGMFGFEDRFNTEMLNMQSRYCTVLYCTVRGRGEAMFCCAMLCYAMLYMLFHRHLCSSISDTYESLT